MKNKVFFLSILFFAIIYGTSCERDNNNTTELTIENLDGNWMAKDNDYDIASLYFESDHLLSITQKSSSSSSLFARICNPSAYMHQKGFTNPSELQEPNFTSPHFRNYHQMQLSKIFIFARLIIKL